MNDKIEIDKADLIWLLEMAYGYIDDCNLGGYSKLGELAAKHGIDIKEIQNNTY